MFVYPISIRLDTTLPSRCMAKRPSNRGNKKIQPRLDPLMHVYLQDLVEAKFFGRTPTAVAQRLIEDGIRRAIGERVIDRRFPRRAAKKKR